jgi:uncharacterized protein
MRRRILPLLLLLCVPVPATAAEATDPTGSWIGTLVGPGAAFELVLRIRASDGGGWQARLDVPVRGVFDSVVRVGVAGDSLNLELSGAIAFHGVRTTQDTLDGTWSQQGYRLPLRLVRQTADAARRRPQDPAGAVTYVQREVRFRSPDGEHLAGTLHVPARGGPHPAAVLVAGSGPQDRDGSHAGHRPFAVLADHLARQGIAVLRYDQRGVGASTGDFAAATPQSFAADAAAAWAFLAAQPGIDTARVGFIGHSEGGMIAPLAVRQHALLPAFVVLLAAPGLPIRDVALAQAQTIARAEGAPERWVAAHALRVADILDLYDLERDDASLAAAIRSIIEPAFLDSPLSMGQQRAHVDAIVSAYLSPWSRAAFRHDPAAVLRSISAPVLALGGSLDTQVDTPANLDAITNALRDAGIPRFTVETMPGLNHFFQSARTGAPSEYGSIDETFAPAALLRISSWIHETMRNAAAH